jgi:hypothetical protein
VESYLARTLAGCGRAMLIDTGLYRTLVKPLLEARILHDPAVLFFASKNATVVGRRG